MSAAEMFIQAAEQKCISDSMLMVTKVNLHY